MIERESSRALPASFLVPGLAVVAATFAFAVWVASREWFYGDDFIFLRLAQMPRDWWQIFVPLEPRLWWSYRPLTIEVFFAGGFALFGLRAFPFLLVVLLFHFASGLVLFRIALRLGFERRVAFFAGCLLVLMYPSLHEVFWASALQPVAAVFFYLLAVSCFLVYQDEGRRRWLFASLAAQVLVALSNELGVTLPGVVAVLAMARGTGGMRDRLSEAIRRTWPYALVLAAYLLFRFVIMAPSQLSAPAFYYQPNLGLHMLRNLGSYFFLLTHEHWLHGAVVAVLIALGWAAALSDPDQATARALRQRSALTLAWTVLSMAPFIGIWYAQHRMVIVMEAPFCLFLAAHLDAAWSRWGRSQPQIVEWALVLLLAAAVPYQTLWTRGLKPLGDLNHQIVRLMREHYPEPPPGTCVALHVHDAERWKTGDLFAVWFVTSGLLSAVFPDRGVELRVANHKSLREEPPPRCVVIEVLSRNEARFGRPPIPRNPRRSPAARPPA
jgi:hypothetical protein